MTPDSLPSSAHENLPAYDPQLDAEDAALSSGNTRLGIIVGALFALGVLSYALVPRDNGSSGLAAVTPSFLLEGASVTATRETEPEAASAAPPAAREASASAATAAPKAAPAKTPARPAAIPAGAGAVVAASAAPLTALEPVAAVAVTAPAPVAEPVRASPAATLTLSGRILDEEGKPLVGATVLLKGSSKGTSTDANGHYELVAPAGDNGLVFGYGGYSDEEVHTRTAQPLNVTLTPKPGAKRRRR